METVADSNETCARTCILLSPRGLVEKGEEDGAGDGLLGPRDGAPGARHAGVAHVDVPLEGEQQRQPDGGRVENLRHVLHHGVVRVAGLLVGDRAVVAQREHVKVPEKEKIDMTSEEGLGKSNSALDRALPLP